MPPPPRKYGLIRGLLSDNDSMMVNSPLIRPYFFGGLALGGPLRFPLHKAPAKSDEIKSLPRTVFVATMVDILPFGLTNSVLTRWT